MMNVHRRKIVRLKEYDYSQEGAYFVTVCVLHRKCLLGEIVKGKMKLNEIGLIVRDKWLWLDKQYDYVNTDKWCIMPNHIHCILFIINDRSGVSRNASTKCKSIGQLIGAFKTVSTKQINDCKHTSGVQFWQHNFHDRIIRNENELNRIREYVINNPMKWEFDRENSQGKPDDEENKFWKDFS